MKGVPRSFQLFPQRCLARSIAAVAVAAGIAAITLTAAETSPGSTPSVTLAAGAQNPGTNAAQVEIECRFIELPDAQMRELNLPRSAAFTYKPPTAAPGDPEHLGIGAVLDETEGQDFLRKLNDTEGADLLSAPRITTRAQVRAVIEIVREFRYPTEYERKDGKLVGTAFETRNTGVTVAVEPTVGENEEIDLKLEPEVVEFLGFKSYPSGTAMPAKPKPGDKLIHRLTQPRIPDPPFAPDETRQPVFHTRKLSTSISVFTGQTVVFQGIAAAEQVKDFELPSAGRQLLLLVRAKLVKPIEAPPSPERRLEAPPAVAPPAASAEMPNAIPVERKPGYVVSPHAPQAGYIDVRGFPAGTEVKCPYSGKFFRIP